ncbi:MAG: hypothetical protein KIG18_01490 [Candidatus Methanomethylophilaceae archaeon]|nr:hypothetical protein [Candidatus Methanomethylophilaceae archaeon]
MRFKLIATSLPYTVCDNPDIAPIYLKEYIEKIKNADDSLELPEPVIEDHNVYIDLMHASQIFNLAKALSHNLIICIDDEEPTIEIYDDWRE